MTIGTTADKPRRILVYRHALVTRITHWVQAVAILLLLGSGLQIFNAHPSLYWGQFGADEDRSLLSITAERGPDGVPHGYLQIGDRRVVTTGLLGLFESADGSVAVQGFPAWATIPSWRDLATGRRWHIFFAWTLVLNGLVYLAAGAINGHFRRDLAPARGELAPRHVWRDILDHARLRFPKGDAARRYNILQKLSYLGVIFVVLPLIVLTGLTMSPGADSFAPFLLDLFGGRQSARTIHFFAAFALVLFVILHIVMVLLAGVWNEIRSMITGRYAITVEGPPR